MKKFILILVISSIAYGKDWSELALCINNLIKPTDAVLVKAYGNIQYDLEKALTNSGVKVVNHRNSSGFRCGFYSRWNNWK